MSPRTSRQLQELKANKKQIILEAALKVFALHGYNGATIELIARKAGVAKGLLYSYYESKENLVEELILFGLKKAASYMEEKATGKITSKKVFEENLRHLVNHFLQEPDFWRFYTMMALQPKLVDKFKKEASGFLEQYLGVYLEYFKKKGSKDPVTEAMLFGAVLDGLMFDLLVLPGTYPLEDVLKLIVKKFA
jgi:AcrR family transcriptional regulator